MTRWRSPRRYMLRIEHFLLVAHVALDRAFKRNQDGPSLNLLRRLSGVLDPSDFRCEFFSSTSTMVTKRTASSAERLQPNTFAVQVFDGVGVFGHDATRAGTDLAARVFVCREGSVGRDANHAFTSAVVQTRVAGPSNLPDGKLCCSCRFFRPAQEA